MSKKIICIDFDGVLHSYTSAWSGPTTISDEPVKDALEWLRELVKSEEFDPQIYSSRSKEEGACDAIREWLIKHGLEEDVVAEITFPTQKPPAFLTVDDRAFHFEGTFPTLQSMSDFKPWTRVYDPEKTRLDIVLKVNGAQRGRVSFTAYGVIEDPVMQGLLFDGMFKRMSVNMGAESTKEAPEEDVEVAEPT